MKTYGKQWKSVSTYQNRAPELNIKKSLISWGCQTRFYKPWGPRIDLLGPPGPRGVTIPWGRVHGTRVNHLSCSDERDRGKPWGIPCLVVVLVVCILSAVKRWFRKSSNDDLKGLAASAAAPAIFRFFSKTQFFKKLVKIWSAVGFFPIWTADSNSTRKTV